MCVCFFVCFVFVFVFLFVCCFLMLNQLLKYYVRGPSIINYFIISKGEWYGKGEWYVYEVWCFKNMLVEHPTWCSGQNKKRRLC